MEPKLIKTEAEYQAALGALESLWDAAPGTPEGNAAEVWTVLIEKYEREQYPIDLPDPVSAIKFRMEQADLKAKDLVPFIGSPAKVSEVLNGKRSLSLNMIRSLRDGLGISADVLLGKAKRNLPEEIPGMEWDRFPLAEMLKRGWFVNFQGTLREARQQAEELIRGMVESVSFPQLQPALLRCNVRSGGRMDRYALLAWQLRAHALCEGEALPEYVPGTIDAVFINDLVHLSALDDGPQLAREYLAKFGIYLVVEPHLPKTHLDGAAMWHGNRPLVGLTLRYDRLDHFWFTLVHELAHLALHIPAAGDDAFLDDDLEKRGDVREDEADDLAADCLIPRAEWASWISIQNTNRVAVRRLAKKLRIHPSIVAGRVRREQKNYRILTSLVSQPVRECLGVQV